MIEAIVLIVVKPGNEEKVYQEIIKDPASKRPTEYTESTTL